MPRARSTALGVDSRLTGGYYARRWFLAGEVGFDWLAATHITFSDAYRTMYSDAKDGWYGTPGGTGLYRVPRRRVLLVVRPGRARRTPAHHGARAADRAVLSDRGRERWRCRGSAPDGDSEGRDPTAGIPRQRASALAGVCKCSDRRRALHDHQSGSADAREGERHHAASTGGVRGNLFARGARVGEPERGHELRPPTRQATASPPALAPLPGIGRGLLIASRGAHPAASLLPFGTH